MPETVETVVIGAGQAGLAMSYYLGRLGREHVVIERGRVAERWRSERWDSLAFQFPNWTLRLPGHRYQGEEPDAFMGRDGVVRFLEGYARLVAPPVHCGTRVTALSRTGRGRLSVETDHFSVGALNVVVATGPYQVPVVPACAAALPLGVFQITANRYTNPGQLPEGKVLVIGSGGSGCQIAEDLLDAGRAAYLSVGRHRRVPRRYRGRDFGWWQEKMGALDWLAKTLPPDARAPLLTGAGGGHDVDLRALAARGLRLLGRLRGACDGKLQFEPDLHASLLAGDAAFQEFTRAVDACVGEGAQPTGCAPAQPRLPDIAELDIRSEGIGSVIWATGYRYDFGWIKCPVFGAAGRPVHQRGVTDVPGLYFLGLARLHKVKSAFLWGVGEDAAFLAERIAQPCSRNSLSALSGGLT